MRYAKLLTTIGLGLVMSCLGADTAKVPPPRFPVGVTCFNGKLDSGSFCSDAPAYESKPAANVQAANVQITRGMICGWPGQVSELHWEYVGRQKEADLYRFTRRFPFDTISATTTSNTVAFTGKRITVFKDEFQVIVIEGMRKDAQKLK